MRGCRGRPPRPRAHHPAGQGVAEQADADDLALVPAAATQDLVTMIERAGPYGAGNAQPRFALTGVRVSYAQPVGDGLGDDGCGPRVQSDG